MKTVIKKIDLETQRQFEFIDVTSVAEEALGEAGIKDGLLSVFVPHTTGAVAINHNEPMLLQDMMRLLYHLVPIEERYSHDMFELTKQTKSDGRSNGHSHCKNILLGSSQTIPVKEGKMMLGEKQSIFYVELDGGRSRDYVISVIGE